jgi:hypothetical protein
MQKVIESRLLRNSEDGVRQQRHEPPRNPRNRGFWNRGPVCIPLAWDSASHPFSESLILKGIRFGLKEFKGKSSVLLYRGSRDGFAASAFHSKCDRCSNTVTIIETTKGYIFGGFTPLAWDSASGNKVDSSHRTFLFTVKNPHGNEARVFPMKADAGSLRAIYCNSSYGPIFGDNSDICVRENCNANEDNHVSLGGTFANDTEIPGDQVFTGERYFTVKEIEIFAIEP